MAVIETVPVSIILWISFGLTTVATFVFLPLALYYLSVVINARGQWKKRHVANMQPREQSNFNDLGMDAQNAEILGQLSEPEDAAAFSRAVCHDLRDIIQQDGAIRIHLHRRLTQVVDDFFGQRAESAEYADGPLGLTLHEESAAGIQVVRLNRLLHLLK